MINAMAQPDVFDPKSQKGIQDATALVKPTYIHQTNLVDGIYHGSNMFPDIQQKGVSSAE